MPEVFQGGALSFYKNVVKGESSYPDLPILMYPPTSRQINELKDLTWLKLGLPPRLVGHYSHYVSLYDYVAPDFAGIRKTLEAEMGWSRPECEFEHLDCRVHDIPCYMHTRRFPDLTEGTLYERNLVRLGLLSREQAMENEMRRLAERNEPESLPWFLEQTRVTREEFDAAAGDWRRTDAFRHELDERIRRQYNRTLARW